MLKSGHKPRGRFISRITFFPFSKNNGNPSPILNSMFDLFDTFRLISIDTPGESINAGSPTGIKIFGIPPQRINCQGGLGLKILVVMNISIMMIPGIPIPASVFNPTLELKLYSYPNLIPNCQLRFILKRLSSPKPASVSYTHLTLPTN